MRLAEFAQCADAVIDTVGGPTQDQLFALAKLGGIVVSAVSPPNDRWAEEYRVRSDYFIVDVNSTRLDAKELAASVGTILPLAEARAAHECSRANLLTNAGRSFFGEVVDRA